MARKVIVSFSERLSPGKAEATAATIAAHLGCEPADVLVLGGAAVSVFEVPEKPAPQAVAEIPTYED